MRGRGDSLEGGRGSRETPRAREGGEVGVSLLHLGGFNFRAQGVPPLQIEKMLFGDIFVRNFIPKLIILFC